MRNKRFSIVAIILLLVFVLSASALASPTVNLDGKQLTFEVQPVIEDGRALVPLRAIFEAMGATVSWDSNTQTATAQKGTTSVILPIGSLNPTINGQARQLDVPGKIVNGRTLAPLRFVGEAFGYSVNWDSSTQVITIKNMPLTHTVQSENPVDNSITTDQIEIPLGHYVGDIVNGTANGHGVLTTKNGVTIEGKFVNGMPVPNGKFKMTFPNRMIYEGDVVNNMPCGQGKQAIPDKGTYIGGLKSLSQWEGYGEQTLPNSYTLKIIFKNHKPDGAGTLYRNFGNYVSVPICDVIYQNGVIVSKSPLTVDSYTSYVPDYLKKSASPADEIIESNIAGEFEGWYRDTIIKLENGQEWKQISPEFEYHYAMKPDVRIYPDYNGNYQIHIEGIDNDVYVTRIK